MDNVVHGVSPSGIARRIVQHRALIMQMVRRDVIGRYRGSVMGILWSFFNPLLMLAFTRSCSAGSSRCDGQGVPGPEAKLP